MKNIYWILFILLGAGFSFTSCSEEEPFSTATADDEPRIKAPTFPERDANGGLGTISEIDRDVLFSITVTTTPADFTSVVWTLDGEEVGTEKTLEMNLNAGVYHLRVDVSTPVGKTTFREGLVKIKALAEDPQSEEVISERIVATGGWARLSGTNLEKVAKVALKQINIAESKTNQEVEISDITYVESDGYIEFKIPSELSDGEYRVEFIDVEGSRYGANTMDVTSKPLITAGPENKRPDAEWTITGLNLDKVVSLSLGGNTITTFVEQYSTRLTFISPAIADGDYVLTGISKSGENVSFFIDGEIKTELAVTVKDSPLEVELWNGHHYVSWDLPEGDPNRLFDAVQNDVKNLPVGTKLKVYYSIKSDDSYHKIRFASGWWTELPGYPEFDVYADGVSDIIMSHEILDLLNSQDGFLCVGFGYYVDRITYEE